MTNPGATEDGPQAVQTAIMAADTATGLGHAVLQGAGETGLHQQAETTTAECRTGTEATGITAGTEVTTEAA